MAATSKGTRGPQLYPLSANQLAIWLDQSAWPELPLHQHGVYLELRGELELRRLRQALEQLVRETLALQLRFALRDGLVWQYLEEGPATLPRLDFRRRARPLEEAQAYLAQRLATPLPLDKGACWAVELIQVGSGRYLLGVRAHALVLDRRGLSLVCERLAALYSAYVAHESITANPAPGFLRAVQDEQHYCASEAYAEDAAYWRARLATPPVQLLAARGQSIDTGGRHLRAESVALALSADTVDHLRAYLEHAEGGLYDLLLCALAVYLARTAGATRLLIGTRAPRGGARYRTTLGPLASWLPLVLELDPLMPAAELLTHCRLRRAEAIPHWRYPLSEVNRRLELLRRGRGQLFEVVVEPLEVEAELHFGPLSATLLHLSSGFASHPLVLGLEEGRRGGRLLLTGSETLFGAARLQRLGEGLVQLLEEMAERPEASLSTLELLGPTDLAMLRDYNQVPYHAPNQGLSAQLEAAARRWPEQVALEWGEESLGYQELMLWSGRLAMRLLREGVGQGDLVAICTHRGPELILALLAVIRVGAAWLPLDPEAPRGKQIKFLAQGKARLVLGRQADAGLLYGLHAQVLAVDEEGVLGPVGELPPLKEGGVRASYLIYTLGNPPKGVVVSEPALLRRLDWFRTHLALTEHDRVCLQAHFATDAALVELLLPLLHGATLVLAPERLTPRELGRFVLDRGVSCMTLLPASLRGYVQAAEELGRGTLRVALCSGETLPAPLVNRFLAINAARLYNLYGPTEAVLGATAWAARATHPEHPVPLGTPLDNTRIQILDESLQPLPVGQVGEICIGGTAIADGYLGDEVRDMRHFIPDPFATRADGRLFRSGDLGYLGDDGQLYFVGRSDRQLRLHTRTIDPEAVEALIDTLPGVQSAAVRVLGSGEEARLHAYVVSSRLPEGAGEAAISPVLQAALPNYLQPRSVQCIEQMPLDPVSGKIDREALPPPLEGHEGRYARLDAPLLEQVSASWQQALGEFEPLYAEDNFFDRGGDSLALVTLAESLSRRFDERLSVEALLLRPTLGEQVALIEQRRLRAHGALSVPLNEPRQASLTLYLCAASGEDLLPFTALAEALHPDVQVKMLRPPDRVGRILLPELAQRYLALIGRGGGPTLVGGYSLGGFAALELAQALAVDGRPPQALLLIDTPYPRWPLTDPGASARIARRLASAAPYHGLELLRRAEQEPALRVQLEALSHYRLGQPCPVATWLLTSPALPWVEGYWYSPWQRYAPERLTRVTLSEGEGALFGPRHVHALAGLVRRLGRSSDVCD